MFSKIQTRAGTVVIRTALIGEVMPLFQKAIGDLNKQTDERNLLYWLADVFSEEFADTYGEYSDEYLSKFVLCALNARHYVVHDKEEFCSDFNAENLPVQIGFDGTFYPAGIGHWVHPQEFAIV